jgi:hypothetical protein
MSARPREAGLQRRNAGAERPPFRFWAGRLRRIFFTAAMMFVMGFFPAARASDDCRPLNGDVSWAEWLEGSTPRGARLVFDGRWQEARTMHGQWLAYQMTSVDTADTQAVGMLRFGLPVSGNFAAEEQDALDLHGATRIETVLHPQIIERWVGAMSGNNLVRGLFAITLPQHQSIATLAGFSRVVGLKAGERIVHATAIAVDDGCLLMYGIITAKDGHQLSTEELEFLNSTLRVEKYEPDTSAIAQISRPSASPARRSFEDFRLHLGLD